MFHYNSYYFYHFYCYCYCYCCCCCCCLLLLLLSFLALFRVSFLHLFASSPTHFISSVSPSFQSPSRLHSSLPPLIISTPIFIQHTHPHTTHPYHIRTHTTQLTISFSPFHSHQPPGVALTNTSPFSPTRAGAIPSLPSALAAATAGLTSTTTSSTSSASTQFQELAPQQLVENVQQFFSWFELVSHHFCVHHYLRLFRCY